MTAGTGFVLVNVPVGATAAWLDAASEAEGRCTCTGACGRSHSRSEGRCPRTLKQRHRLFLTGSGALECSPCLDAAAAAARKAQRDAAEAADRAGAAPPGWADLFSVLAETDGGAR